MYNQKSTFWKVWLAPIVLGILSGVGLLSALTGDGIWDLVSWLTLGVPVVISVWFISKSRKRIKG